MAAALSPKPAVTPVPLPTPDSPLQRLPGKFPFNGKVTDLYLLKDPYRFDPALFEDTLQNFYP